jgi:hypothetical protein
VLDLLLVPEESLTFWLPAEFGSGPHLEAVLGAYTELAVGVHTCIRGFREFGLPKVPVELCAPLHCMLAEAVALDPGMVYLMRAVLVLMQAVQEMYFQVSQCNSQCNTRCNTQCTNLCNARIWCACRLLRKCMPRWALGLNQGVGLVVGLNIGEGQGVESTQRVHLTAKQPVKGRVKVLTLCRQTVAALDFQG